MAISADEHPVGTNRNRRIPIMKDAIGLLEALNETLLLALFVIYLWQKLYLDSYRIQQIK